LVPIGFEVIAIGVSRAAMDQREHRQVFLLEFSRWIEQHAFDFGSIMGGPAIRLALGSSRSVKSLLKAVTLPLPLE